MRTPTPAVVRVVVFISSSLSAVSVDARACAGAGSRVRLHRVLSGSGYPHDQPLGSMRTPLPARMVVCVVMSSAQPFGSIMAPRPFGSMLLPAPARTVVFVVIVRSRGKGGGSPCSGARGSVGIQLGTFTCVDRGPESHRQPPPCGSMPVPSQARRCVVAFIGISSLCSGAARAAVRVDAVAFAGAEAGRGLHPISRSFRCGRADPGRFLRPPAPSSWCSSLPPLVCRQGRPCGSKPLPSPARTFVVVFIAASSRVMAAGPQPGLTS